MLCSTDPANRYKLCTQYPIRPSLKARNGHSHRKRSVHIQKCLGSHCMWCIDLRRVFWMWQQLSEAIKSANSHLKDHCDFPSLSCSPLAQCHTGYQRLANPKKGNRKRPWHGKEQCRHCIASSAMRITRQAIADNRYSLTELTNSSHIRTQQLKVEVGGGRAVQYC